MERIWQLGRYSLQADKFSSCSSGYVSEESFCASADQSQRINSRREPYQCVTSIATPKDSITSLAFHGSLLYAGSQSGTIQIFEKSPFLVRVGEISSGDSTVKALVIDKQNVYSAHHDNKIRIWRHSEGNPVSCSLKTRPRGHDPCALKLLKTLPTVKDCLKQSLWSNNYVQVRRHHTSLWIKHVDAVTSLALCLEDQLLYSASWDKTVKVWRLSDFKCVESIKAHDDAVNVVSAATNGILFTGSADGTVKVWRRNHSTPERHRRSASVEHHEHVTTLKSHQKEAPAVNDLALSPDESVLYCGTSKGEINCWRMDKGSLQTCCKDAMAGHKHAVLCLATLKKFVCSGSADSSIRVWEREVSIGGRIHHSCLAVLQGHTGPVKCIAASLFPSTLSSFSSASSSPSCSSSNYQWASNGFVLFSGSLDGTLKQWWVFDDTRKNSIREN